jgi:hypothetical protein
MVPMIRFFSMVAALLLVLPMPVAPEVRSIEGVEVTVLPQPSWERPERPGTGTYSLKALSSRPNKITDEKEWFERNDLELDRFEPEGVPAEIPRTFQGSSLIQALYGSEDYLLLYGKAHTGARYVVGMTKNGAFRFAFDFVNFLRVPDVTADEFNEETVTWAVEEGGVLYVANGHRTYASSSKGLNAYLTAIDLKTGKILWRSRPLVANAQNFVVADDVIATGYGFTKEPDFLYLIDKKTGDVVARSPLRTGPDYVLVKNGKLYVRCYNADYEFEVQRH